MLLNEYVFFLTVHAPYLHPDCAQFYSVVAMLSTYFSNHFIICDFEIK
jgi:hypothetical protein